MTQPSPPPETRERIARDDVTDALKTVLREIREYHGTFDAKIFVEAERVLARTLAFPAPPKGEWPEHLIFDLDEILGMMCFQLAPIAHAFNAAGVANIPEKAEREQSYVLHWLIGLWFKHGSEWRKHAGDRIRELQQLAGSPPLPEPEGRT